MASALSGGDVLLKQGSGPGVTTNDIATDSAQVPGRGFEEVFSVIRGKELLVINYISTPSHPENLIKLLRLVPK